MRRRTRRGGRHGRNDAAARRPGGRLPGRRRPRKRGEAAGWFVGKMGRYPRAALSRQGPRLQREAATRRQLTLVVPARDKLNLDLAVLERTNDGWHEVRTHIQAVALHDLLELTQAERRTTLTTTGHHVPDATG